MEIKSFVKKTTRLYDLTPTGWGNGYVCIPKGHPLWGKHYDKIDVTVHGGLTFSEKASDLNWDEITEDMKDDWIIGFDTCHYDDNPDNCPKEYVEAQTRELVSQIEGKGKWK